MANAEAAQKENEDPSWYDGKKVDEVSYCEALLAEHEMRSINKRLYTMDGLVEDPLMQARIAEDLKPYIRSYLDKAVDRILKTLKLLCASEPIKPTSDRIHFHNGTYFLKSGFVPEREWTMNRLPVDYVADAPAPVRWEKFLSELMYEEDVVTLQEFLGYSMVVTNKGTILVECGHMLAANGYEIRVLDTINFRKSHHYNPFMYIRSEKDILKLVNTIIANTKGEGEKSSEDFWVKAEKLYYQALIGYIWYEAPDEEKNFSTLLEMINASEAREDDENFKNAVDLMFEELENEDPGHFAVRQYKKYKLAAGTTCLLRRETTCSGMVISEMYLNSLAFMTRCWMSTDVFLTAIDLQDK